MRVRKTRCHTVWGTGRQIYGVLSLKSLNSILFQWEAFNVLLLLYRVWVIFSLLHYLHSFPNPPSTAPNSKWPLNITRGQPHGGCARFTIAQLANIVFSAQEEPGGQHLPPANVFFWLWRGVQMPTSTESPAAMLLDISCQQIFLRRRRPRPETAD